LGGYFGAFSSSDEDEQKPEIYDPSKNNKKVEDLGGYFNAFSSSDDDEKPDTNAPKEDV
jgi:hypothetical protein